jgi:hypothetical protein
MSAAADERQMDQRRCRCAGAGGRQQASLWIAEQTFGTCASEWLKVRSFARSLGKLQRWHLTHALQGVNMHRSRINRERP